MQIVLTIQLQQDNGTPVATGTQTKTAFSPNTAAILSDLQVVNNFLVNGAIKFYVRYLASIAAGQLPTPNGNPVTVFAQLGDASGD